MFTQFWDMHSGGGTKEEPYDMIFIEAPLEEAKIIFYNRFGHNPERVTCTCCGEDYSIDEYITLKRATAYHRGCVALETPRGKDGLYQNDLPDKWFQEHYYLENKKELKEAIKRGYNISDWDKDKDFSEVVPLKDYLKKDDVLVIYKKDIKNKERVGDVPIEGYIWM